MLFELDFLPNFFKTSGEWQGAGVDEERREGSREVGGGLEG